MQTVIVDINKDMVVNGLYRSSWSGLKRHSPHCHHLDGRKGIVLRARELSSIDPCRKCH